MFYICRPFCGTDVGGFFGNPDEKLLTRWYQAGIFSPFFRAHGHIDAKRREPWLFGEPYLSLMRKAIQLRYSLLPYWYTLFYEHSTNGSPVIRPLWVEFPSEEEIFDEEQSFMVGSELLVRPITQSDVSSIYIYLPGTQPWYDLISKKRYEGSARHLISTPLERIPAFVKGGSILPFWTRVRRSTFSMMGDPYTLLVALDDRQQAKGSLYLDDGHSFEYQSKSAFIVKNFHFEQDTLSATSEFFGQYSLSNLIEKIEFWGLKQKPSSILLQKSTSQEQLEFEFHEKRLIIRKPNILIIENWTLTLKY